jgi:hypothetical protein
MENVILNLTVADQRALSLPRNPGPVKYVGRSQVASILAQIYIFETPYCVIANSGQLWWYTPVTHVLRKQKQETLNFEVSLGYRTETKVETQLIT